MTSRKFRDFLIPRATSVPSLILSHPYKTLQKCEHPSPYLRDVIYECSLTPQVPYWDRWNNAAWFSSKLVNFAYFYLNSAILNAVNMLIKTSFQFFLTKNTYFLL